MPKLEYSGYTATEWKGSCGLLFYTSSHFDAKNGKIADGPILHQEAANLADAANNLDQLST